MLMFSRQLFSFQPLSTYILQPLFFSCIWRPVCRNRSHSFVGVLPLTILHEKFSVLILYITDTNYSSGNKTEWSTILPSELFILYKGYLQTNTVHHRMFITHIFFLCDVNLLKETVNALPSCFTFTFQIEAPETEFKVIIAPSVVQ